MQHFSKCGLWPIKFDFCWVMVHLDQEASRDHDTEGSSGQYYSFLVTVGMSPTKNLALTHNLRIYRMTQCNIVIDTSLTPEQPGSPIMIYGLAAGSRPTIHHK